MIGVPVGSSVGEGGMVGTAVGKEVAVGTVSSSAGKGKVAVTVGGKSTVFSGWSAIENESLGEGTVQAAR